MAISDANTKIPEKDGEGRPLKRPEHWIEAGGTTPGRASESGRGTRSTVRDAVKEE